MRNFEEWLKTFRNSINRYDYYVDFEKVYANAERYKFELNLMNSLIGSKNIEDDFRTLLSRYPECIKVVPLLLAVRDTIIYCQDKNGCLSYVFCKNNLVQTLDEYCYFMKRTGLFDLISHHVINNLFDYVTGVEVGLDSNGRKNRGGHQMEDLVESFLIRSGVDYYKEMYLHDIERKWDVDLSAISAEGTSTKRWDFVVKTEDNIFCIETNFYTSGGSKLNETARSYKMIAEEASMIDDFHFVWVTDGAGWYSARRNLEETFDQLPYLFNIADLEGGVFDRIFY